MAEIEGWTRSEDDKWLWTRVSRSGTVKKIHLTVANKTFSFENVDRLSLRTLEGILDEVGLAIVSKSEVEAAHAFIDAARNEAYDNSLRIEELASLKRVLSEHNQYLLDLAEINEQSAGETLGMVMSLRNQMKKIGPLIGAVALWMKTQDHEALKVAAENWRTGK
jgi:hypothetical protein